MGHTLRNLGLVAQCQGNYVAAENCYETALVIYGDRGGR
jgi:hypothetical protein